MRAFSYVIVAAAVLVSGLFLSSSSASADTPTPETTPEASATQSPQRTPPIPLGTIVPGGPDSFVPTPAADPSLLRLVLVDYELAPNRINFREPVTLIAHDEGPSCNYRRDLSLDQAQTLFTTGELELTLPARCSVVEITYRELVAVPTMDCTSGQELCKREEVVDQSIFLALQDSEYLSRSMRALPAEDVTLPDTGRSAPEGTEGGYAWILPLLVLVSLSFIGLRIKRR